MKRTIIVLFAAITLFAGCVLPQFEEEEFDPPATALAADVWTDGTITVNSENWYKFTATAATQYIHFALGTLYGLNVQLFNSEGKLLTNMENFNFSTTSKPFTVTIGQVYYIQVTPLPHSNDSTGPYKIAFNDSATRPTLP